jgi:GNAT superfamily N-acetyltransferase
LNHAPPVQILVTVVAMESNSMDPLALREVYDSQLRAWLPDRLPAGMRLERDGPLVRVIGDGSGFLAYRSLDGLHGPDLDALIARQRDFFAARGEEVEWKLHGHDLPADLPDRLVAAGFEPEEQETVVIGLAAPLAAKSPPLPEGVRLREVTARADLNRIAAMEEAVWNEGRPHLAQSLEREIAADPEGMTVVVAEGGFDEDDPGTVVSAGWVRFVRGTAFATLWGGSTLKEWRGRGIYRALVAYRAWLAVSRGHTHVEVDASDDSRPILQRSGFVAVTTTTPYVFTPPPAG